MNKEHYSAIGDALREAGISRFLMLPELQDDDDVRCAELLIDPQDFLMDTSPERSVAIAMNALTARGLVRLYDESKARIVAKTIGPGYAFLVDSQYQPPAPSKSHRFPRLRNRQ